MALVLGSLLGSGLRLVMGTLVVPSVPHIQPWVCIVVLVGALAVLMAIGGRGFYRRAID